jgi:hypothetical protein
VIGAFAAQLHGAPIPRTRDIDFTPATEPDNLERLSAALHELRAKLRASDAPDGLPFDHDASSLARVGVWNLICAHGEFDLSFTPSGTDGYEDLASERSSSRSPDSPPRSRISKTSSDRKRRPDARRTSCIYRS